MVFHRVVLDEAQQIRNRNTRAAQACFDINAEYRWALTWATLNPPPPPTPTPIPPSPTSLRLTLSSSLTLQRHARHQRPGGPLLAAQGAVAFPSSVETAS